MLNPYLLTIIASLSGLFVKVPLVKQYPDATLAEYCEYWLESHKQVVSESMMCRALQKLNSTRKKKRSGVAKLQQIECSYSDVITGKKFEM